MVSQHEDLAKHIWAKYRWRSFLNTTLFDGSLHECAAALQLDENEVHWAIEEYGRCDTEKMVAWCPSEENGLEWPTAEAPAED